jgi:hypothetical protein
MAAFDGNVSNFYFTQYSSTIGSLGGSWTGGLGATITYYLMSQASNAVSGITVWLSKNPDTTDRPVGPTYSGTCWIAAVLG